MIFFGYYTNIYASNSIEAKIGNTYFDSLEEAIEVANSTDIIELTNDISLDKTLEIHKNVNINLNNHTVKSENKVFLIKGGSLNLKGEGVVEEKKPYYGAITIIGSDDPNKKDFSTISVERGITLKGWSGIFIDHNDNKTAYGILVNMNGKIEAVNDTNGDSGAGIYVNGNIKHENNSPIINLSKTSKITSTGTGIYSAGYAIYNITGSHIEGEESALGIKSGVFNILDGNIIGTGKDKTPANGNNNGINPSGTSIQIESNSGYAGNIELYIKDGKIQSNHSNVIYEYTVNNSNTQVKKINITGGIYISKDKKNVFLLSNSFKSNHPKFISGGKYSSDPSEHLKNGFSVSKDQNSLFEVVNSTINVFSENKNKNKSFTLIPLILSIIMIGISIYVKKHNMI